MVDLTKATDAEIHQELERRRKEAEEKRRKAHEEHAVKVKEVLTMQIVKALAPEHSKAVCAQGSQGFYCGDDDGMPGCTRCGLEELVGGQDLPSGVFVELTLTRRFH